MQDDNRTQGGNNVNVGVVILSLLLAGAGGAACVSGEPWAGVCSFLLAAIFTLGTLADAEKQKGGILGRGKYPSS